ncbi:carboxymuconolactone decarboxylase family protein [Agromyces mariniharenae]|uniref:Carboxymuconolactone decarboxylase family protein n=1 Tax=Agromyces mariniharenae TaxID=2604423 RepID=A0A5S4UUR5_9MICO|nr:carboxymuconolactone decarboxylase family protein [Agromyces mariniharenae]TYL50677.1 carboxymuconolactone decarboxylase family protein [Agromyces mariniharenae]
MAIRFEHLRFENTRFDPDLTEFHDLAKQMAAKFGYTAELSIDARLAELLRLRVAQLDPCSYCLVLHTAAAERIGIDAETIAHVAGWRESAVFTDAEKAALAYCEGLTTYDLVAFPGLHERLLAHFDEAAIAEIAAVIINMTVWTRLKLAQGATPVPVVGGESGTDRLG